MKKIFLLAITILLTLTLTACVSEEPREVIVEIEVEVEVDNVEFSLVGNNVINVEKDGTFYDPGVIAMFGLVDISNEVTVTGNVDVTVAGTYFLTYELTYESVNYSLLRAVVVTEEVIIEPEEVIVFSLIGNMHAEITVGEAYVEEGFVTTIDEEDVSTEVTTQGTVNVELVGVYFIEYTFEYEGIERTLLRSVTVLNELIVEYEVSFTLISDLVIELDEGDSYEESGFTASTTLEDLVSDVVVTGVVDTNTPGLYYIEYSLTYNGIEYILERGIVVHELYDAPSTLTYMLNNDVIIELTTAESYVEYGFVATFGLDDLSGSVITTGTVDTSTPGTYFIEYALNHFSDEITLLRAAVVTETTIVIDPDVVLAANECTTVDIHYIDLDAMGDATLIDCGNFEVLIDAGLKSTGSNVIVPYLNTYVTDGVIELVIATHPDADHIGGFVGLSTSDGIFQAFEVERVLDFGYVKSTTTTEQYIAMRDSETLSNGTTAVCSGEDALNNVYPCQPYYTIMDNLILTVVDTGHYDDEDTTNDNENSIVVMLEHGNNTFLFTGDAEHNSEAFMAAGLPHIDVYKAGHHGSHTANGASFLASITPTDIILSVDFPDDVDGENGYGIPQQESLDRMFLHTNNIYATGVNGTIIVSSNATTYTITGEVNTVLLKDSVWFSTRRTYPVT